MRVQFSSVAVHSAVGFGAGKMFLSGFTNLAISSSPCLCIQCIFNTPFHFFPVLILRIYSPVSKGHCHAGMCSDGAVCTELRGDRSLYEPK